MEKENKLHNVKIIGDGKQHHVIIDGEDISHGVTELNLSVKSDEYAHAELTMTSDVKVSCIELKSEVEEKQVKINKAILEYETSEGLRIVEFESEGRIVSDFNEEAGIFVIEEHLKDRTYKELAVISLNSFVSFIIK